MMVWFKNECSLSGGDNHRWWDIQTLLVDIKKIKLFELLGGGDAKSFGCQCLHPGVSPCTQ